MPPVPEVSDIPDVENTTLVAEEPPPPADDSLPQPEPAVEDETPRKRQKLDRSVRGQPEEVDSADEAEAPTLEEQVSHASI